MRIVYRLIEDFINKDKFHFFQEREKCRYSADLGFMVLLCLAS